MPSSTTKESKFAKCGHPLNQINSIISQINNNPNSKRMWNLYTQFLFITRTDQTKKWGLVQVCSFQNICIVILPLRFITSLHAQSERIGCQNGTWIHSSVGAMGAWIHKPPDLSLITVILMFVETLLKPNAYSCSNSHIQSFTAYSMTKRIWALRVSKTEFPEKNYRKMFPRNNRQDFYVLGNTYMPLTITCKAKTKQNKIYFTK